MFGLNRNIWLLVLAQPFALAVSPAIVLISGFVGKALAPSPEFATLPLSMMIVGITLGAMPAAFLMQRFGRKPIFLASMAVSTLACGLAALGILYNSFVLFLAAVTLAGSSMAAIHQFRFAAVENVSQPSLASRAISVLMIGTVAAAFIGTEFAALGQQWLSVNYAGSFITLMLASSIAFILLLFFKDAKIEKAAHKSTVNMSALDLLKRPAFFLALTSAAIGYGVMSFVMTATPLAMHDIMGHSLGDTKWVIQSHIMAMFLPSLVTGELIRKFGVLKIILAGLIAYVATTACAFSGVQVFHYWWALVLLGIGWNFLFIGGTTLLTTSYADSEKFRAQAINDVTVFVFQALASFSAGAVLFMGGWSLIVILSIAPTLLLMGLLFVLWRPVTKKLTANT